MYVAGTAKEENKIECKAEDVSQRKDGERGYLVVLVNGHKLACLFQVTRQGFGRQHNTFGRTACSRSVAYNIYLVELVACQFHIGRGETFGETRGESSLYLFGQHFNFTTTTLYCSVFYDIDNTIELIKLRKTSKQVVASERSKYILVRSLHNWSY